MTKNELIWRFTPSRTNPELLESIFVQREDLLTDIFGRVKESATTGNKHHVLLIGPRGIGKTHLVSLLNYRLTKNPKLAKRLRIAWFLEDETITSFVQLLKRIYELLSAEYPNEFPADWLMAQLEHSPEQIEKQLKTELVRKFNKHTLLLLIENLDYLFDGLKDEGQKKWRAFLQEHPFTCIVATSQRLFDDMQKREEPFFGFFTPTHLKLLSVDDAIELLSRIAEKRKQTDLVEYLHTPEGRSRCRALHHLAGGNHRIYIVLSEFISRETLDELTQPFEKMADELTPYYQERMRWLSPQQRQIVELLCNQESTCTPKKMAHLLLAKENTISSQLKKLLDLGYVIKSSRGRESLYELAEPLMRLASEVKEKRQKPLRLLVNFLRIWYRPEQLPGMLEAATSQALRTHLSAAIAECKHRPDPRLEALRQDIEQARADGQTEELVVALEERAHTRGTDGDWIELAIAQQKTGHLESAIVSFDKSIEIDPLNYQAWCLKGVLLCQLKQYQEAIQCFDKAIEINSNEADHWIGKSYALQGLKLCQDAIYCSDRAIEIDQNYIHALASKASALHKMGNFQETVECSEKVLEINMESDIGWYFKGISLSALGRHQNAIECFEKCIEIGQSAFSRCQLLFALQRWQEGFSALQDTFSKHPDAITYSSADIVNELQKSANKTFQIEHLTSLIKIYAEADGLTHLGDSLVHSLEFIDRNSLSEQALTAWRDIWLEKGAEYPKLELPLRLFRVGIEYLLKNDEAVLLDLIESERRILQQALDLEPK